VLEDSRVSMGREKQIEDNGNNKPRLSSLVGGKKQYELIFSVTIIALLGGKSCLIYLDYPAMFNPSCCSP
jgi:hypothetical protein